MEKQGLTRRDFLKFCSVMAATLGLPAGSEKAIAQALEAGPRPPIIWLEFQSCTADSESFLREPTLINLLFDSLSLDYHERLMVPSGSLAEKSKQDTIRNYAGQYICVVEGSIPTGNGGVYAMVGGKTALSIAQEACGQALATIAVGNCAWDGGIAAAAPNPTGAMGVKDALPGLSPLINLPGCPMNVYNLTATIIYYLTNNQWPLLDSLGRPTFAYGEGIHDRCERKQHFEDNEFVLAWGDPGHRQGWCLFKMGCKGPSTKHNCPTVRWNSDTNWPVGAGHGCIGCATPKFWDQLSPFYSTLPKYANQTFLPLIARESSESLLQPQPQPQPKPRLQLPPQRIVIDPITRIEGHLRLEAQIENNRVAEAWSSAMMFRGLEIILKGRDPRDAWIYTQRICGVCTTVHSLCSVRAVENALGITIPDNARLLRSLLEGAQFIQDHVVHFYHLHALDWVDIVSALKADAAAASTLQKSISDWPNSSPAYFQAVKSRLSTLVNSGQLGLFANGYWGHPAYKLTPEVNLIAMAHYLEALDWQREFIKFQAVLGGKNPHPQTYLVGGMAIPMDPSSSKAINAGTISQLKTLSTQALDFVSRVYIPDLRIIASFYKDWAALGAGHGNYLAYGDWPTKSGVPYAWGDLWLPRGIVLNKNLAAPTQILDQTKIGEQVTRSWYNGTSPLHPSTGETQPNYTGPTPPFEYLDMDQKYSWLKTPRYNDLPMEVGPLSRMLVAYAAGHTQVRQEVDKLLTALSLGPQALFSTLGRVAARGIETLLIARQMPLWLNELEANLNSGNLTVHDGTKWDPATWPAECQGWGATEAPRGALGHWIRIKNRHIENYQAVVATTWNGSPRDSQGQRGIFEEALLNTPVADPARPLEILRTIHSFDPCMACAVHVFDPKGKEITKVAAGH